MGRFYIKSENGVIAINYYGQLVGKSKKYYEFEVLSEETVKEIKENKFELWNRDSRVINELPHLIIRVDKSHMNISPINEYIKQRLRVREWFKFELGSEKLTSDSTAILFKDEIKDNIFLNKINFIDRRKSEYSWINSLLNFPTEVINENIDEVNLKISQKLHNSGIAGHFLAIFDVDQGSCNAICNLEGEPQIYLDFGHGNGIQRKELNLCNCSNPIVILSHLHKDHWNLINHDESFYNNTWIIPVQQNTLQSLKVFKKLWDLENLICTNKEIEIYHQTPKTLSIFNCDTTNQNLNHSGRSFTYHITSEHKCLIPGDAKYEVISESQYNENEAVSALIVTHHGGSGWKNPPKAYNNHISIWNFGRNNKYGHPSRTSIVEHTNSGWNQHFYTHQGNIAIGSKIILNHKLFNTHECSEGSKRLYKNIKSF